MTMIGKTTALFCLGAALSSTQATANPAATGSFQVSASVPMACWVDHSTAASALGSSEGLVTEGCNSASGYVVSASYRPLAASERARLVYGNRTFDLSAIGHQEVRREHGPRIQEIAYRFDGVSLDGPLTLSLTIQPI